MQEKADHPFDQDQPPKGVPQRPENMGQERKAALLVGAGAGLLVVIGSLLPWKNLSAPVIGSFTRSGVDLGSDGTILLIGGLVVAVALVVVAFTAIPPMLAQPVPVIGLIAGIGGAWLIWADKSELQRRISGIPSDYFVASVGAGVWVALVGSVLLAVSMLWLLIRTGEGSKEGAPKPPPAPS
jgi:hypothetical protein